MPELNQDSDDDDEDWTKLHYVTGILIGLAHKYGVVDVTIYFNSIRVRIDHITPERGTADGKSE